MAPLLSRIVALEANARAVQTKAVDRDVLQDIVASEVAKLPPAPAGKDADLETVSDLIRESVKQAVSEIPVPRDGKDGQSVTLDDIQPLIKEAVAALPPALQGEQGPAGQDGQAGRDGLSLTAEDVAPLVQAEVINAVSALPPPEKGEPGRSVELSEVQELVTKAIEAIPKPQDGHSVTLEEIEPLVQSLIMKSVEALPRAKDGISVVDALVNRDGRLVQTFSDGSTKDVGVVVGRDYDSTEMARMIAEEVAKIPRPKDGRDGTLENVKSVQLDERTWGWQFKDGTPVEGDPIVLDHPLDRGVWRPELIYVKGDGVSFGGSFFIAQRDDPGKPEVGDGWRLAVKRGRDGKAGRDGKS
jgi:hypothetical protein